MQQPGLSSHHTFFPRLLAISTLLLFTMSSFLVGGGTALAAPADSNATIAVSGTPLGVSTHYIGANAGPGYDYAKFNDIGFNSMRIWDDITEFEPADDSSTYGSPAIAQIKGDKNIGSDNLIPWSTWDSNFSTYRSFFDQIKKDNVRLMVSLRSTGNNHGQAWLKNQPPKTTADWNEWWEHVFAEIYWLNVRNNYHVDDWEIFNEPDNGGQGWNGDTLQYETFVQYTSDAIKYVYHTFLPGRTPNIYASALSYPQVGGVNVPNGWQDDVLHWTGSDFNAASYHYYHSGSEFLNGASIAHTQLNNATRSNYPVWLTEWGSYDETSQQQGINPNCDSNEPCAVRMIDDLILGSQPGDHYLYGSEYYVFGQGDYGDSILDGKGNPRTVYYALRLGTRALQGGKTTFKSTPSSSDLDAITTQDTAGNLYLLTVNTSGTNYTVNEDVSALYSQPAGGSTIYRYDANNNDTSAAGPAVTNGHVTFSIPANGAALIKIDKAPAKADKQVPSQPGDLKVTAHNETQVSLSWSASTDNVGVETYVIYANGKEIGGTPNGTTTATLYGLKPDTTYSFQIKARDAAGNQASSSVVKVKTDRLPVGKYEAENGVFANGAARDYASVPTYSGLGFVEGFWNVGASDTITVKVPGKGDYIVNLRYTNGTGSTQPLSIYVNGSKVKQTQLSPLPDWQTWGEQAEMLTLKAGTNTITYQQDKGDGSMMKLDYIEVTASGAHAPAAPNLTSAQSGAGQATLTWSSVPDAAGYKIKYGNGNGSGSYTQTLEVGNVLSQVIPDLVGNLPYYFVVTAYNRNGESASSNEQHITVGVSDAPVKLSGTPFGSSPASSYFKTYNAAFDGDLNSGFDYAQPNGGYVGLDLGAGNASPVTKIRFAPLPGWVGLQDRMIGGKFQGSNTSPTSGYVDLYTIPSRPAAGWNDVTITASTSYRYLRYLAPDGGYGDIAELEFYRPNYPGPTAPVHPVLECVLNEGNNNYIARFGYQNDNATPVVVPAGALNGFNSAPLAQGQPTTFLTGRQQFVFNVPLSGGNLVWSLFGRTATAAQSSTACPADTQPPSAPSALIASNRTATSITLAWTGSTDNIAVAGYDVYANNNKVATTTDTTVNLTDQTPDTTYSFVIKARDGSGNVSDPSNTLTVTTPTNWVASASAYSTPEPPALAVDRDPTTRWSSGALQTPGMYFQVDLTKQQTFSKIVIDNTASPNDYPRAFSVYVSDDGSTWGNPVATGSGTPRSTTITFAAQTARYVRIQLTAAASDAWWSIHELYIS